MQYIILFFAIIGLLLAILFTLIRRIVDGDTAFEGLWQRGHPNHVEMIGMILMVIGIIFSIGIFAWSSR